MIHDIEHLHAELCVEVLRDFLDAIVLEHGEVQIGYSGADNNVAASIAAQIGWSGNSEAVGLDIVVGVSGIGKRAATGAAKPVRKSKIVVIERISRVVTRPPCGRKRDAVADREDHAEFPSIGCPLGWSCPGFSRRNFPGAIHY